MFAWLRFARLRKEHIVAPPGFNRWLVPPASIAIHLCIGSVYAWSLFNSSLTKVLGVAAPAADDWQLSQVVWIFSVAIVFLGLSAAIAGKWLEDVGPKMVGSLAAILWGGGFLVGALGIYSHQLWLLYLGYGVIGGCGLGLGYVSPVSTLIRWFPDRRGMATGMAIMGFGGGAMLGKLIIDGLLEFFYRMPTYLGPVDQVKMITENGVRYAQVAAERLEVVVVGAYEQAAMTVQGAEGVYVVASGSTGVVETFLLLGICYFIVMVTAAFSYRVPAEGWKPEGWTPPTKEETAKKMMSYEDVHIDQALKTPQFYFLWVILCFNVTAGIGVISVAKTMMSDIFGATLPHVVDAAFASTYVLMISVFNMVGRFLWASTSDYIGRKATYFVFFTLGTLLYLSIPYAADQVSASPAMVWLVVFYAATMVIFTMYGGGFATIPAYLADIFGTRYVGGIHGRLLTAWSTAGVLGPYSITYLRERSMKQAINDLVAKIGDGDFAAAFGAGKEQLASLVEAKTVTIQSLLAIAPEGTVNPSAMLYNSTMFAMAGLLVIAFFANLMVRPVHSKHHM